MAARTIRDATPADAVACAQIYAPYVSDTVISFETVPPDADELLGRITDAQAHHAWLVLEEHREVVGSAYAHRFSGRAAYDWSCEVSIYLQSGRRRTGAGRALYEALFARLAERGYRRAFAAMALPNEASVGLHQALGFEPVGVYHRVGWKHGAWRDVAWVQKTLADGFDPPAPPQ
jgi:L-amino acid N-acyltransferase YncA